MIVFVDLVGTLGDRQWTGSGQSPVPQAPWQTIWSFDRDKYAYWYLRPSAMQFLEALHAMGFIIKLFSSSKAEETAAFVQEAGLIHLFSDIYGRDSHIPIPQWPWVLVEDRDPDEYPESHPGPHYKVLRVTGLNQPDQEPLHNEQLSRMLIAHCVVKAITYVGGDTDSNSLLNLLPQIQSKLSQQLSERNHCV